MIKQFRTAVAVLVFALCSVLSVGAQETAVFAGGCFWCMEEAFEQVAGVTSVDSGYAQGWLENPTYRRVTRGDTGHAEVVEVRFDPAEVGYEELLKVFWRNVDPFDGGGQFCDRGDSYRPGIYFDGESQRTLALASLSEVQERFSTTIAVEVEALDTFYRAEDYHQDYYETNSFRYRYYKTACGRQRRLEEVWGSEGGYTG